MIWESRYWKKPLLRTAKRLRALKNAGELGDKQYVQLERDIFIGFYSVRKLFETFGKITDATKSLQIQLSWHPNRKEVDWLNNHRLDELYDFESVQKFTKDIGSLQIRLFIASFSLLVSVMMA
jgi:hypothetical protein